MDCGASPISPTVFMPPSPGHADSDTQRGDGWTVWTAEPSVHFEIFVTVCNGDDLDANPGGGTDTLGVAGLVVEEVR